MDRSKKLHRLRGAPAKGVVGHFRHKYTYVTMAAFKMSLPFCMELKTT